MARTGKARLFVALDLPRDARIALVAWQENALADREGLRAVAPDALHVTLAFLGHRPEEEIDPMAAAVESSLTGLAPARLAARAARPVPRRRPRLFALDLGDEGGRAAALHGAVSGGLEAGGFYEAEKRAFWPHVTVARVRRGSREMAPLTLPPPNGPFVADEVVLYRSHLGRGPARYEALERWPLRQG